MCMKFTLDMLCQGLIPTKEQENNLNKLINSLNVLFSLIMNEYKIVAGLLTEDAALTKDEDKNSPLITGEAILLEDRNFELTKFLLNNIELLERNDLYMRNPAMTVSKILTQCIDGKTHMINYVFLQIRKAESTIFNGK